MLSAGYLAGIPGLIAIRLVAALVFAGFYARDRKPLQLLILTGWLVYALATVFILTSTGNRLPLPAETQHILSSVSAYIGTALLMLAAACYMQPEILKAARSIIGLMLVLTLPAVLLSTGSEVAVYFIALQGFCYLLGASVLWFERRAAVANLSYGYYGFALVVLTGLVTVSIVLTGQFLSDVALLLNTAGTLILVMVFISAEHTETLEKLRQSSIRLAQAENLAKIGYWERNVITEQAYWSSGHYKVFGVSGAQSPLSSEEMYSIIHPEDVEEVRRVYQRIQRGSPYEAHEFRIVLPNGEVRWINADTTQQESAEHWVFGVTQDVTERKVMELRVEKALEETAAQLEAVVLGLPTTLHTLVSLLHSTHPHQTPNPEYEASFGRIQDRVRSLLKQQQHTLRNGLSLSAPTYLKSICSSFSQELMYDIEEFTLAPELILPLGIIVHELVDNSVVHGVGTDKESGTDTRISLSCGQEANGVVLSVQDNGPGFTAEFLKTLADGAPTEGSIALNGEGLGMVVVQALATQINAQLKLMNNKGARVELRVTPEAQPYN